jgi:hypothetical protein
LLLAAAVTIGIAIWCLRSTLQLGTDERLATVQAISGVLYRIDDSGTNRLGPGATLTAGELIRADDAPQSLLRLADGSAVELGERAEFTIESGRGDTTLHLNRGQIIVQATKRTAGHLYVATRDCRVAVTGTVFSVLTDVKGSRVSVLDGSVHVAERTGSKRVLARGDQLTTSPTLSRIPIEQEIAWSRNLDEHLALLREMTELGNRFRELPSPALRYVSSLLDWAPENAFLYTALPNYGSTLNEGYQLFRTRLEASPLLRRWWQSNPLGTSEDQLDAGFDTLTELSSYLGEELVITASRGGDVDPVVALAEVKKPGLREWLESKAALPDGEALPLAIVDAHTLMTGPLPKVPTDGALLLVTPAFVALSTDPAALEELAIRFSVDDRGAFAMTALGQRVAAAYEKGISLFVAADLETLRDANRSTSKANPAANDVPIEPERALRFIELDHEDDRGRTVNSGVFTFGDQERGAAAWLKDPAPMGSLHFMTPEASAVAAFMVRDPATVFGEIFRQVPNSKDALTELPEFGAAWDARMSEDLSDALGAEVAIALDGPVLPLPAWKIIVEVRDREGMERTLERWATRVDGTLKARNSGTLSLEHDRQGTWIAHRIKWIDGKLPLEMHYAFVDGYFVATPTRMLLARAIEARSNGTLLESPRFRATLPRDGRSVFSGLVYQNLVPALATAVNVVASDADLAQKRSLDEWARNSKPSLVAFYATQARIEMIGTGELFPLGPEALALPALLRHILPESLDAAKP